MDFTTIATVAFFAVLEPIMVLTLAPLVTSRRVHRDAVKLVETVLVPRLRALMEEEVSELSEEPAPNPRVAAMNEARMEFRALEEQGLIAVMNQVGPAGVLVLEQAKGLAPTAYKLAVRAGPEALAKLAAQGQQLLQRGDKAPAGAFL